MKVMLIDTNSTADFSERFDRWPDEMREEFEAADVVLGLFSPYSALVLKGEETLEVADWRRRVRGWVRLTGSADPDATAAENDKLRGQPADTTTQGGQP